MRIKKGQPGYIKAQKTKYLIGALAEFAIVIALVVLGYVQTGTRLNLFTLFAVLGCLPASKLLVEFITMAPYQSISPEKFREIEEKTSHLTRIYDMIITGDNKVMPVKAIVIEDHTVLGYTDSERTDEVRLSRYLKEMLKNNRYDKMTIKIYHNYPAFAARAEEMERLAASEKDKNHKKEKIISSLILTTSM